MRKLKLHMDISVDGFVAGSQNQQDWLTGWAGDDKLLSWEYRFTDSHDTILLGRNTVEEFTQHWESVKSDDPDYEFARRMVDMPKVVFSKTLKSHPGKNVRVENGPLVETVKALKGQAGKDILVYGGVTFVSSLLENKLIDELNFIVNPVALGQGKQIFNAQTPLKLVTSTAYANGVVVNTYTPG
jgi:dihydrofolate reductase